MNRTHPKRRRDPWVQGSLASWMAGVTLGTVLGVTLLIVTPRLMAAPGETAKAPTAAAQTAKSAPDGTAMSGSDNMAGGTAAKPGMSSTAKTAATTETPADSQTSGGALPAAQSPAVATTTTGAPAQQDTNGVAETVAAGGTADAAPTPNAAEGDAAAGTTIFAGNCAGCHGAGGGGGIGANLLTSDGPKGWTLAQFTTVMRKGVLPEGRELSAVMPRFADAQLSDTQIADVLAHIKTLN